MQPGVPWLGLIGNTRLVLMTNASLFSICAAMFAIGSVCNAQVLSPVWTRATWPVIHSGDTLPHPWVGGLTAPQWSPIDADLDGDDDLFAFDRDGSRILLFERQGSELTIRWDWTENWPVMQDWCLLRDYNCDGKPDIFTSHQNGIRVYTNITGPGTGPIFDPNPMSLMASFDFGAGASDLPVICLGMDLPAIHDNDDDGDLDIITFTETASTLYRFQGQTPCGLDFECTNRCYGMLAEASENNALFIGDDFECSFNVIDPRTGLHAGGAITTLQLEEGGPKDLIISDVSYPQALGIVLVDGLNGLDSAVFVDPNFPANLNGNQGLNLPKFPAAFHLDVDQDGIRDLLFSPNTALETDDDRGVHWFRNTGSEEAPSWEFITEDFIQKDMVDLGRGAYPLLMDLDGDGLVDLMVANKERYEGVDQTPASIATYKNVGTADNPVFELIELDAVALSDYQIESPYPALGDLDGDGDLDLIVGDELGLLHRFDNNAGPGNWPSFGLSGLSLTEGSSQTAIDVGQFATPQLWDLDNDGDLDMLVGEKNGTFTLFEQSSLGTWNMYDSPVNGVNFGGILVDNLLGINGYSVPALTATQDGVRVLVANETGTVQDFGLWNGNWDATLEEVDGEVLGPPQGFRGAVAFAQLNGDSLLDAVLGIQNGGMLTWMGGMGVPEEVVDWQGHQPRLIWPNPGKDFVRWSAAAAWHGELQAWSMHGRLVHRESIQGQSNGVIDTSSWPAGGYILHWYSANDKGAPSGAPLTWIKLQ